MSESAGHRDGPGKCAAEKALDVLPRRVCHRGKSQGALTAQARVQTKRLREEAGAAATEEAPRTSYTSNPAMLKSKTTPGLGLGQHCVPEDCLQKEQESSYYNYWTNDNWTKN